MYYPTALWRMPAGDRKALYLTFDDGPVPGPTEFVLDTLRQFNVRATFFCIGDNVHKYPEIFSGVIRDGHDVGNHTQHHVSGWSRTVAEYVEDIHNCDLEFARHGYDWGRRRALFRPPYGRIRQKQIKALGDYTLVMWDVLTQDYRKGLAPERCLRNSLRAVRDGSIVVFHDSIKASENLTYVLPRFVDACLERGFRFATIRP